MKALPRIVWPLLLSSLTAMAASPAVAGDAPSPSSVLQPGAKGVALTALRGNVVEELPLTFIGTYKDFAGPGYDLHLVQLEGPVADTVGIAAGMSGSPVYIEGQLVGALSYRLGSLPKVPIAGVTPIETMLDAGRRGIAARAGSAAVRPIATPIFTGGLHDAVRDWFDERLEGSDFSLVGGGGRQDDAPAAPLRPGSPVGVELVRGDLSIAATGTVTWTDDEQVYAFGHPFLGAGRIEMPMVSVEVLHTLADLAGSTKLSMVGPEVGAFLDDRLTAIVGRTDRRASMIPVHVSLKGGAYAERTYAFEVVKHSTLTPLLVAVVTANTLFGNTGYDSRSTILGRGSVRFRSGLPELSLDMAFAGEGSPDPALQVAVELQQTLAGLWSNRFEPAEIEGVELALQVSPEVQRYQVQSVHYDRLPLRRGQTLEVACTLGRYRGDSVTRKLKVRIPETVAPDASLVLVVGAPEQIQQVAGQPLALRAKSATDLRAIVEAFNAFGAPNRLTAALFQQADGVIGRGESYERLPPTAARLLGSDVAAVRPKATRIALLSSSEVVLDGPVLGAKVVRLPLDSGEGQSDGDIPEESEP